jgi:leader peptidase (prepilin peptidase)/N-methyltransferase
VNMAPAWFWYLTAFLFGSVIGSFLNVVIHRLPREESIVFPPSRCPACRKPIRPWDNIPLVSWLILRGRCRNPECRAVISPRYPAVELSTALLFTAFVWKYGPTVAALPWLVFSALLVAILFIDLDHQIIPDELSLPGLAVGLAVAPILPHPFLEGILGVMAGTTFFYLTAAISFAILGQEAMGDGDIKMAAMMGAFLGWKMLAVGVFVALLAGSAVGVALLALKRRGRRDAIPFGPFLALGGVVASLVGERLLAWYLNLRP